MNDAYSGVGKQALEMVSKRSGAKPYCALTNGSVVRFVKSKMPIKIFISQGWMLPGNYGGNNPTTGVLQLMKQKNFWSTLPHDPSYHGNYHGCAMQGLHAWDWARSEGILDYQIVQSPQGADVLVFWCPKLQQGNIGNVVLTGYTSDLNLPNEHKVIIQLVTGGGESGDDSGRIALMATHEFGHCWGLGSHSANPSDVMYSVPAKSGVSENDRLTLRALYDIAPDVRK